MVKQSCWLYKIFLLFSWVGWLVTVAIAVAVTPGAAMAQCTLSSATTLPTVIPNDVWTGLPTPNALSRVEREFKFAVRGTALQAAVGTPPAVTARALAGLLAERLGLAVRDPTLWKAPTLLRSDYSLGRVQQGMVVPGVDEDGFLDFYFDTDDALNYRTDVSYRLRLRFGDRGDIDRWLTGRLNQVSRIETQSKVDRKLLPRQPGLSEVTEHRFPEIGSPRPSGYG